MSEHRGQRDEPSGGDGSATLRDLPGELWQDLARAFRRAVEPLEEAELPRAVRPYRGWKPDRLLGARPRRAVADALAADARLRERVGEELGDEDTRARLSSLALGRLVAEEGEARTAALLVSAGRWDDLATLAADVSERRATRERAAAEGPDPDLSGGRPSSGIDAARLAAADDSARRERAQAEAALERAKERSRALTAERDDLAEEVAKLRGEVATLEAALRDERARHRDRLVRARRRAAEADARKAVDEERIRVAASELEALAGALRQAVGERPGREADAPGAADPPTHPQRPGSAVPRTAPPAAPGRPCRLPPGLVHDDPSGVHSLLCAPGVIVIVDGYNVSKQPRAVGGATLDDQRRWLVRLLGGLAARFRVRPVVVFDSAEDVGGPLPAARGVVVDFATQAESADDRIVGLVAGLDPAQPVLVVTSDRELADRCGAFDADVVPSEAFIAAAV